MNIELTKQTRLLTKDKVCRENIDIIPVLQQKTATANGTVVPDSGYVGLSKVVVSTPVPTASVLESPFAYTPKFGSIKYFAADRFDVRYMYTYPTKTGLTQTGANLTGGTHVRTALGEALAGVYQSGWFLPRVNLGGGNTWKEAGAYYANGICAMWLYVSNEQIEALTEMQNMYFPPCTCKIVVIRSDTGMPEIREYSINEMEIEAIKPTYANGAYTATFVVFTVTVGEALQIEAAEFVYEKHNITLAGNTANLEYSTDVNPIFTAASSGTVLNQVEHIKFWNRSTSERKIGTIQGGNDIATLQSGQRLVVATKANGTWYIS